MGDSRRKSSALFHVAKGSDSSYTCISNDIFVILPGTSTTWQFRKVTCPCHRGCTGEQANLNSEFGRIRANKWHKMMCFCCQPI